VTDPEFLRRYQYGIGLSSTSRCLQIVPGNYWNGRNNIDISEALVAVNLPEILEAYETSMAFSMTKRSGRILPQVAQKL
jgi:hypothetical protein